MTLKNTQLVNVDVTYINGEPSNYDVAVFSEDRRQFVVFACADENAARQLRDAICEHADHLRSVADYRYK